MSYMQTVLLFLIYFHVNHGRDIVDACLIFLRAATPHIYMAFMSNTLYSMPVIVSVTLVMSGTLVTSLVYVVMP